MEQVRKMLNAQLVAARQAIEGLDRQYLQFRNKAEEATLKALQIDALIAELTEALERLSDDDA